MREVLYTKSRAFELGEGGMLYDKVRKEIAAITDAEILECENFGLVDSTEGQPGDIVENHHVRQLITLLWMEEMRYESTYAHLELEALKGKAIKKQRLHDAKINMLRSALYFELDQMTCSTLTHEEWMDPDLSPKVRKGWRIWIGRDDVEAGELQDVLDRDKEKRRTVH